MRHRTFASLFSGGGGADLGAIAAGYTPLWAVEYDPDLAAVYRANLGDHVITADVAAVDYTTVPRVHWLHASPVCTAFSVANSNRGERDLDMAAAVAVVRALHNLQPDYVTIENVSAYQHSASYRCIVEVLTQLGYFWHAEILNAADFGVPQTRRRLIVRASRDLLPSLPAPTPWRGWYAAIEDLLDTLPASAFPPWQLARLPEEVRESVLFANRSAGETQQYVASHSPAFSITLQVSRCRAWLFDGQTNTGATTLTSRPAEEPAFTLTATTGSKRPVRSWLTSGRVVQLTARALARLQSFPDSYVLPERKTTAMTIIGNAVPPLLLKGLAP